MKKTVYMMESYMTYVNKGSLELDMRYFPEFEDLTDEEIAEELSSGEYFVNYNNEIMPKSIDHLSEEIKEDWRDEDGNIEYSTDEYCTLWNCHNESEVDFDKIKNEEHYFYIHS